jgi:hypothetical protein
MTTPTTVSPLRQRMTEDMIARRLVPGTQVGHIRACKRFAAWLKRDSVDMGDPQGPLRRVGLPLTNGHGPGGSWHGGSVPRGRNRYRDSRCAGVLADSVATGESIDS